MVRGALATIYVSDMDQAVDFYTRVLGLELEARYGDEWASIDAGDRTHLDLHPRSPHGPAPGISGSISIGLAVTEPLVEVMDHLREEGVAFRGPVQGDPNASIRLAFFGNPDGNDLYLFENGN